MVSCCSITYYNEQLQPFKSRTVCIKLKSLDYVNGGTWATSYIKCPRPKKQRSPTLDSSGQGSDRPGRDSWDPAVTSVCCSFCLLKGLAQSKQPTWYSSPHPQRWGGFTIIGSDWEEIQSLLWVICLSRGSPTAEPNHCWQAQKPAAWGYIHRAPQRLPRGL